MPLCTQPLMISIHVSSHMFACVCPWRSCYINSRMTGSFLLARLPTQTPFHVRIYFISGVNNNRGLICCDVITGRCVNSHTHIKPRIRVTYDLQPESLEARCWKHHTRLWSSLPRNGLVYHSTYPSSFLSNSLHRQWWVQFCLTCNQQLPF